MSDQVEEQDQRDVNPSGLPDGPAKSPQLPDEQHHEEGHVDPEPEAEQGDAVESPS